MKIFISHSSKNVEYGNALVNLLTGVGISGDQIIFTSNDAYGIPTGQNIFDWLKNLINEKPYVLYLLSPEYYKSVACLNEMGAAWVTENKHTMIFTPNFKLDSYEFRNGALDPREIGFYINNYDKLIAFIDSLRSDYNVTTNQVLITQKIREFIEIIKLKSEKEIPDIFNSIKQNEKLKMAIGILQSDIQKGSLELLEKLSPTDLSFFQSHNLIESKKEGTFNWTEKGERLNELMDTKTTWDD